MYQENQRFKTVFPSMLIIIFSLVFCTSVLLAAVPQGDILQLGQFQPTRIEIVRPEGEVTLETRGSVWYLTRPVDERADQQVVADFLQRLSNLTVADVLPRAADAPFGLDEPQASIRLFGSNGEQRELLIGNLRSPVSLFVQPVGSDDVYAISNVSLARVGLNPVGFMDRTLLEVTPEDVTRVEVLYVPLESDVEADEGDDAEKSMSAEQLDADMAIHQEIFKERGVWMMEGGTVAFDVEGFLRSIRLVQASGRFMDDSVSEESVFYPQPDTARINLHLQNGQQISIDIGQVTEDGLYHTFRVSDREEIYLVPRFQAGLIVSQALNINDSLINADFDQVNQVKLIIGPQKQETIYRRNNAGVWESNRAIAFNIAPLLEAIGSIGVKGAADDTLTADQLGFGTHESSMTIELEFRDKNVLTLSVGAPTPQGDGVFVRSNEKPGTFVGIQEAIAEVLQANASVRTKLFPLEDPSLVTQIRIAEVSASGDQSELIIDRDGQQWVSGSRTLQDSAVNSLLTEIGNFSADELPQPPEDESSLGFYPAPESKRITIAFQDGTERYLDIGGKVEVGSGWFATINFYVTVSDLDDLTFVREQSLRRITRAIDALR